MRADHIRAVLLQNDDVVRGTALEFDVRLPLSGDRGRFSRGQSGAVNFGGFDITSYIRSAAILSSPGIIMYGVMRCGACHLVGSGPLRATEHDAGFRVEQRFAQFLARNACPCAIPLDDQSR